MSTMVIDLSHHNTISPSLKPAKDAGVVGVIHKATEGATVTDDKLAARFALAKDAGLLWGVYHFIRPGDPVMQVDKFVEYVTSVKAADKDTLWALDYEDPKVSLDAVLEFMSLLEEGLGRPPVLYGGHVLKEEINSLVTTDTAKKLAKYRLWLAQYGNAWTLPKGWSKYWLWQYTDKGTIPGIFTSVDLNRFEADSIQLKSEWAGGSTTKDEIVPTPAPTPDAPPKRVNVLIDVDAPPGVKVNLRVHGATTEIV